jgi:hypothetical protein
MNALLHEASEKLSASKLGMAHVKKLFSKIEWQEMEQQISRCDAAMDRQGLPTINLYPRLKSMREEDAIHAILREFGNFLHFHASDRLKKIWKYKLSLPEAGQIESFQGKLTGNFKDFAGLVESYNTAVDRLVAINLSNALIANGASFGSSHNTDVRNNGATEEYAARRRRHSLTPLLGAYCCREMYTDYGFAFAELVMNDLQNVSESSTQEAFRKLVVEIAEGVR